jgi:rhodanese-related sulfurtransferase
MVLPAARALCLMGTGAILGLLLNGVRADGVPLSTYTAPNACASSGATGPAPPPGSVPAVEELSPVDAAGLCGDPRTLIADARPAADFAQGHVSGAIHLPCTASGLVASAAVDLVAGRQTLIVYGATTDDARRVADEMRRRVDRADLRVVVLAGGFSAWNQAGLACASGPCPQCQELHQEQQPRGPAASHPPAPRQP